MYEYIFWYEYIFYQLNLVLWFYYSTQDLDSQILNRIEYNNLKIDKNAKRNFSSYALNYEKKHITFYV